jgi:hypothetical protein
MKFLVLLFRSTRVYPAWASFGGKCIFAVRKRKTIYFLTIISEKTTIMKPRKQKHANYKAYFANQVRIVQERFPFLSSKQIKAKVLSSWESFTAEKKNEWGSPPNAKIDNGG